MITQHNLDLKAFETILKSEKTKLEKNRDLIKVELNGIGMNGELDEILDMAELEIESTTDHMLLEKVEAEIAEINAALNRISLGTYGICEKTGRNIPIDRLKANPTARTIVGE